MVADAKTVGQEYVTIPYLEDSYRKSADQYKTLAEKLNEAAKITKDAGLKLAYHNHDFEFKDLGGQSGFDILLKETDPKLVIQQLDIGNMYNGGAKALDILKKYPGRFPSMHVKDEIKATSGNEHYESTVLGKGIVNPKDVIDLGRKSGGTKHFIIEQESYQGKTPIACMKENLDIMKQWGYK